MQWKDTIHFTMHTPEAKLLEDVQRLVGASPPVDFGEAQQRIKILANALVDISKHCESLHGVIRTLIGKVQFVSQ